MAILTATFPRDANSVPIEGHGLRTTKTRAYTGAAGLGEIGATTLFTVTGVVSVRIFGICSEDLVGATATIAVGISGNTAALIALTTATEIDNNEIWLDTGPATVEALPSSQILAAGTDIIETVATANITDGTLTMYCLWLPISDDGDVVAA